MAMKLLAHVLRNGISGVEPAATATLDLRRWVFRDLVVRRDEYQAWGLWRRAPAAGARPRPEPAIEPLWPDTQPWWHE